MENRIVRRYSVKGLFEAAKYPDDRDDHCFKDENTFFENNFK